MPQVESLLRALEGAVLGVLPAFATTVVVVIALAIANRIVRPNEEIAGRENRVLRQLTMLVFTAVGIVLIVISLPVGESMRVQLLSLLGLLVSGAVALSSTTFVGNALAGLMLRAVRNFKTGDFVRVGESFGRVSERGLLHVEIQTPDRDLITLPNLFLVTHPVKVVRGSGTIVAAELSLGYDIGHARVESNLLDAASRAELSDPFVQILGLGDFAVTYRVAGFLADVNLILSARSRLHREILDALHRDGIEIVSPTFMNQRRLDPREPVIAAPEATVRPHEPELHPEDLVFDKAAAATERERLTRRQAEIDGELGDAADPWERARLKVEHAQNEAKLAEIDSLIADEARERPAGNDA